MFFQVYEYVQSTSVPKDHKISGSRRQTADPKLVCWSWRKISEPGTEYGKSHAPARGIGSVREVLAVACEHGWPAWLPDVQVIFV